MKAEKNRLANLKQNTDSQISDNRGCTDEIVSEKLGIGSRDTYRKEKYIVDNKDSLTPEDFADWDEGKLSTNKAYQKIKAELKRQNDIIAEKDAAIADCKQKVDFLERKTYEK